MPSCEVCHAKVSELRRGRCWGCYARWIDARPVGLNARCLTCNEKRRRFLKAVEVHGSWQPMCFNCAGQLLTLDPVPKTIAALREAVSRERRKKDRRFGKPDSRVFRYERRVGERRAGREDYPQIEDEMIIEVIIEAEPESFEEDLTQIRELVAELRPASLAASAPEPARSE
ncbi:MAG: hypothetical protein JWO36_5588 [Myxococcales bacterium]|nr:hypothetical protein [Myxococcales bacterium]